MKNLIVVYLLFSSLFSFSQAVMEADIALGQSGSNPYDFTVYDGKLYFKALHDDYGLELWSFNGSTASLVEDHFPNGSSFSLTSDEGGKPIVYQDKMYFLAIDPMYGAELRVFDGDSIQLVQDIRPGGLDGSPKFLTEYNSELYFRAYNPAIIGAHVLWKYDGDTATLASRIIPEGGGASAGPNSMTVFDSKLFFRGLTLSPGQGWELWSYNGIDSTLEADVRPGQHGSYPRDLIEFDNKLFFVADSSVSSGYDWELWSFDGNDAVNEAQIFIGSDGSIPSPAFLTVYNGKLYFPADDGTNGVELWSFDGNTASMVVDIDPFGSSSPSDLLVHNGKLFFAANDDQNGRQLWSFDGINAQQETYIGGGGNANPSNLVEYQGKLFFNATDGVHGKELWSFDDLTVAVNDSQQNERLIVFPNPSTDMVTIQLENNLADYQKLRVYSPTGELVNEYNSLDNNSLQLNLGEVSGTYLIQLFHTNGKISSQKVEKL